MKFAFNLLASICLCSPQALAGVDTLRTAEDCVMKIYAGTDWGCKRTIYKSKEFLVCGVGKQCMFVFKAHETSNPMQVLPYNGTARSWSKGRLHDLCGIEPIDVFEVEEPPFDSPMEIMKLAGCN